MKLNEIPMNDVYRLVDFMNEMDHAFYESVCAWDALGTLQGANFCKCSSIIWERIAKELGVPYSGAVGSLPSITMDDIKHEPPEVMDLAFEFVYEGTRGGCARESSMESAGIAREFYDDQLSMVCLYGYYGDESLRENDEKIYDYLSDVAPGIYKDFPEVAKECMLYCEDMDFYPSNTTYLHSKRVGNYMRQEDSLEKVLPHQLHYSVLSLINKVFEPMYIYIPDLTFAQLNDEGEYCSLASQGYFENTGEEICSFMERPYAEIAVRLLDRLLAEAEALAPHLLNTSKNLTGAKSDEASETALVVAA